MIILRAKEIVKKIPKRKSEAEMWKDIREGDILEFSVHLQSVGNVSAGGSRPVKVTCQNLRTGEYSDQYSFNSIMKIVERFEFEEV